MPPASPVASGVRLRRGRDVRLGLDGAARSGNRDSGVVGIGDGGLTSRARRCGDVGRRLGGSGDLDGAGHRLFDGKRRLRAIDAEIIGGGARRSVVVRDGNVGQRLVAPVADDIGVGDLATGGRQI